MPGFLITNFGVKKEILDYRVSDLQHDCANIGSYYIERNTTRKFLNDKLFNWDKDCAIITEGVVLGKANIIKNAATNSFFDALKKTYEKSPHDLPLLSEQGWSGAYYDVKSDKWMAFTNPFGDKPVFYSQVGDRFVIATSIYYVLELLKQNCIDYSLNEAAVYDMLTYGYMVNGTGDNTLVNEIKRLPAGCAIETSGGEIKTYRYHNFNNCTKLPETVLESEIVEKIDALFRYAIKLEYDKDNEYNYRHLCALSGGLDSRMNFWVANELGYKNILAETFSQFNTLDTKIAQSIAHDKNCEWIFKPLDDALFIKRLKEDALSCEGLCDASGVIHENSLLTVLDFRQFGILHTGQIGDVVLGSFYQKIHTPEICPFSKANSVILKEKSTSTIESDFYSNNEMFMLYNRGFRGALASQISIANYTECISPFLYLPFFEYCMSIPDKYRVDHYIYKKWIIEKYPEAAKYIWEKTGLKITDKKYTFFLKKIKDKGIWNCFAAVLRRLGIPAHNKTKISSNNMNPYDYWYKNKPWLREYLKNNFFKELETCCAKNQLKKDMEYMFFKGTCREKVQLLTTLNVINYIFNV